jgi:hypothetical protein
VDVEPSKKPAASRFKPEYGGSRFPRNVGNLVPSSQDSNMNMEAAGAPGMLVTSYLALKIQT